MHVDLETATMSTVAVRGHSLLVVKAREKLETYFKRKVTNIDMFRYPTVHALAGFFGPNAEQTGHKPRLTMARSGASPSGEIAVMGMSIRVPGAENVARFWTNLCNGTESIRFFSDEELLEADIDEETINAANYVKAAGFLDDYDKFDAAFFGFTPKEALGMDPQHRLFLEGAWDVLENAG